LYEISTELGDEREPRASPGSLHKGPRQLVYLATIGVLAIWQSQITTNFIV